MAVRHRGSVACKQELGVARQRPQLDARRPSHLKAANELRRKRRGWWYRRARHAALSVRPLRITELNASNGASAGDFSLGTTDAAKAQVSTGNDKAKAKVKVPRLKNKSISRRKQMSWRK